jgi:aryl-alcohol dehydrogenase-like predicted oxidoreductase
MQKAGKIRHLGLSNVSVAQLEQARDIAPVVSVQNAYSLDNRSSEPVLRACERLGIAFLPWYPLAAGAALKSAKAKRVAEKRNATPAQVCIAWLLARSPAMLPIPGTASLAHLEENAAAARLRLSPADLTALA